jgi:hypothetical protein
VYTLHYPFDTKSDSKTFISQHFAGSKQDVRLKRLLDYQIAFSLVYYGDCPKEDSRTREAVGLSSAS